MILEAQEGIEVVAEAADGAEAVSKAVELQPDLVLMDVRMPEMDGIEATKRILESTGTTRVLMLTTFDLDEYVYDAIRAGASGFLLKDVPPRELVRAVRVVTAGDALLSATVTRRLMEHFVKTPRLEDERAGSLATLTDREIEVLELMARGLNNGEIAERLYLSEATIKTHVSRVLSKLNLRDRAQAVVIAYETGLIQPGDQAL